MESKPLHLKSAHLKQNRPNKTADVLLILGVHLVIYYLLYFLEGPLHSALVAFPELTYTPDHTQLKSEYTVGEQLSKFYLFVVMLLSGLNYRLTKKPLHILLSISYLALAFVMYMSESNFISGKAQPVFGLIGISLTALLLLRLRLWLSLGTFMVGCVLISSGTLTDITHDYEAIASALPGFVSDFLALTVEERFDVLGIAFICFSAMICFRATLLNFVFNEPKTSLFILLSAALLTIGNGLLHHQYNPQQFQYAIALSITLAGFAGLIYCYKHTAFSFPKKAGINQSFVFIVLLFFFVILPATYGQTRASAAVLLWLPGVVYAVVYLWRKHPKQLKKKTAI